MAGWKEKRKVMQRYDLTAEIYDERYREEQKAKYDAVLENLNISNCSILDVGCGSGLFFSRAANAKVLVGVDISRKLLLKAKKQMRARGNISVLLADADHLPFREACFDKVFAFTVLQNMPCPSETLNQLKMVVKHRGIVVVTGMKKFFSLSSFMDTLEGAGLHMVSFVAREKLKCYVAVLEV